MLCTNSFWANYWAHSKWEIKTKPANLLEQRYCSLGRMFWNSYWSLCRETFNPSNYYRADLLGAIWCQNINRTIRFCEQILAEKLSRICSHKSYASLPCCNNRRRWVNAEYLFWVLALNDFFRIKDHQELTAATTQFSQRVITLFAASFQTRNHPPFSLPLFPHPLRGSTNSLPLLCSVYTLPTHSSFLQLSTGQASY